MSESTYLQAPPKRKLLGLGVVVALHAVLFWAIQAGLTRTVIDKMPVVVQALLLEEKRPELPPQPPAPPPPPKPTPPPPSPPPPLPPAYVPPAVTPAAAPPPQAIAAVSTTLPPPAPKAAPTLPAAPAPAAPAIAPVRTTAGVNIAQCDKPDYPAASRRMEEEGTVGLRFLVGVDGKVIQSEVAKSSGYKRLDEAARAGLAKCQFKPATVDGKPEQAWTTIQYVWRLE
ncbi:energy transducer TonB [Limnohabitans sp. 2KL-27]|uniref:energy transducer TonB n=1 Tax=Limnohabitans sp. 2KL-27 TaxID=1100705 RepID=UPI000A83A8D2|nr:energy transducer TonB [Limnohabitans sp. 2KL-27]